MGDVIYVVMVVMETNYTTHNTWFHLIENTQEVYYLCKISSQSDKWCRK